MAAGRSEHSECAMSMAAAEVLPACPVPSSEDKAAAVPPCGCWVCARPPWFCLPWWLLAFVIIIFIFFSHDSRVDDYLIWMSPTPRLCGTPWLQALWDVGSPQSKWNRKLTAVFPVILGSFRWIHEDRSLPRSAVVVPVLFAHARSFSLLLGHDPTSGMSWAAPACCPLPGLHGAVLFPFLLTQWLMSSPLARASWGFLITGSGALPAPWSSRMREEVWLPPISRNSSVMTCPNHSVLSPQHSPCCLQHCCFTYYLSNPRDYNQGWPCRNRHLGGQSGWKVAGRAGGAESREMHKCTFLLWLP